MFLSSPVNPPALQGSQSLRSVVGAERGNVLRSSCLASAAAAGRWPGRPWSWSGCSPASELYKLGRTGVGLAASKTIFNHLPWAASACCNLAEIRFVASLTRPSFQMMSGLLRRAATSCRSMKPSLSPSLVARLGEVTVHGTQALARRCHQPSSGEALGGKV